MLTSAQKLRGMTLVELLVAVAIFALLLSLGIGSFRDWIQNSQTRNAAESIMNGLQLARNEAIKRNLPSILVFCDLNAGNNSSSWDVLVAAPSGVVATPGFAQPCQNDAAAITSWERVQRRASQEGSKDVTIQVFDVAVNPNANAVAFSNFGRVTTLAVTAVVPALPVPPNPLVQVQNASAVVVVTNPKASSPRPLWVAIGSGNNARMCDPSSLLPVGDPRRCQ